MFKKKTPPPEDPRDKAGWEQLGIEQRIDLWKKHEDVAMHFNDLAMRLRLQALAGVGAATLLAGSISTHQGQLDARSLGIFLVALSPVWVAIWALDQFYYQPLLKGAVERIVTLESWTPGIGLSRVIEQTVGRGGRNARRVFYGLIFLILLVGGLLLWRPCC